MIRTAAGCLLALCVAIHADASTARDGSARGASAEFGRTLFFDASLSSDGTVSCASCHKPDEAFADGRKLAIGVGKHEGTRNTPSLLDLGQGPLFWDGRAPTLDDLVLQPLMNPVEMGLRDEADIVAHVRQSPVEVAAYHRAFPNREDAMPALPDIQQALAAYVRTIPSGTSAYDRYMAGNAAALSSDARHGLSLFSAAAQCNECHLINGVHARFTDDRFHSTLINPALAARLPDSAIRFARSVPSGRALGTAIASNAVTAELGRYVVTQDPKDIGSFRTPSLRNVAATAPYMHDGSATTLRDAVDREIYYRSLQRNEPNTLTEQDRRDLVAFLESLTDSPPRSHGGSHNGS